MAKVNGLVLTGPDGNEYIIPEPMLDDWNAWILLHEGDNMPPWSKPPYAFGYPEEFNSHESN